MESDDPRYSVGEVLNLIRGSTPACRVLALTLTLACLGVFYAGDVMQLSDPVGLAVANNPPIWQGETYRLVTAPWVHDGLTHLIFVLVNLLFFGPILEDLMGTPRFVLLAAWGTGVALITSLAVGDSATCGASPLDMAVFGALGLALNLRRHDFDPLVRAALSVGLVLSVLLLGALPVLDVRVNGASHLGGLMAGVMVTLLLLPMAQPMPPGARPVMVAVMLATVVSCMGLASVPRADEICDYQQNLGVQQYEQGHDQEAERSLQTAWQLSQDQPDDPSLPALAYDLGYLSDRRGQLAAAETLFRRAIQLKPTFREGWDALAELALDEDRPDKALAWLRVQERIAHPDASIALNRARACELADRLDDATAAVRDALAMRGFATEAHMEMGRILTREGRLDDALAELETTLKGTTNTLPVLRALADVELLAHQTATAESTAQQGLKVNDQDVPLLLWQGEWFEGHLQPADAHHYYRAARQAAVGDPHVLVHLAGWYRGQGNFAAEQRCLHLLLRQPVTCLDDVEVHARALVWTHVPEQAARLVQPHALDPVAQMLLGDVASTPQARRDFYREAATLTPADPAPWFRLGVAAMDDNHPQAEACFERAGDLSSLPHDTSLIGGYLALLAGRPADALQAANTILASVPFDEDALRLAARISPADFTPRLKALLSP